MATAASTALNPNKFGNKDTNEVSNFTVIVPSMAEAVSVSDLLTLEDKQLNTSMKRKSSSKAAASTVASKKDDSNF